MESARPAIPTDRRELSRLWREAVAELDGQRGGSLLAGTLARGDLDGFLDGALSDPERLVVMGLFDSVPVGVASAYLDTFRREPVATLELIYVEPAARRVGVAEAMLDVVAHWSESRGSVGVDAVALPGNRGAKSFFEAYGYTARLLIMHRPGGAG